MTGRPSSARATSREHADLLLLVGRRRAVEEQELGAQQTDALGALGDRLARLGRAADVGEDLDAAAVGEDDGLLRALARPRECAGRGVAAGLQFAASSPRRARSSTAPAVPSSASGVPSATARIAGPRPTTAGMPSALATIAAWPVAPPRAVAIACARSGSSAAASPGVSSSAITMPGAASVGVALVPASWASTWRATSSTSTARSRR